MIILLIFDSDSICLGNINEDLDFQYDDGITVYGGCGATLQNVFWYFGGSSRFGTLRQVKLQILFVQNSLVWLSHNLWFQANKIVGCKLERQADLNFEFGSGACNNFNQPSPQILLCFGYPNTKECHT